MEARRAKLLSTALYCVATCCNMLQLGACSRQRRCWQRYGTIWSWTTGTMCVCPPPCTPWRPHAATRRYCTAAPHGDDVLVAFASRCRHAQRHDAALPCLGVSAQTRDGTVRGADGAFCVPRVRCEWHAGCATCCIRGVCCMLHAALQLSDNANAGRLRLARSVHGAPLFVYTQQAARPGALLSS